MGDRYHSVFSILIQFSDPRWPESIMCFFSNNGNNKKRQAESWNVNLDVYIFSGLK